MLAYPMPRRSMLLYTDPNRHTTRPLPLLCYSAGMCVMRNSPFSIRVLTACLLFLLASELDPNRLCRRQVISPRHRRLERPRLRRSHRPPQMSASQPHSRDLPVRYRLPLPVVTSRSKASARGGRVREQYGGAAPDDTARELGCPGPYPRAFPSTTRWPAEFRTYLALGAIPGRALGAQLSIDGAPGPQRSRDSRRSRPARETHRPEPAGDEITEWARDRMLADVGLRRTTR